MVLIQLKDKIPTNTNTNSAIVNFMMFYFFILNIFFYVNTEHWRRIQQVLKRSRKPNITDSGIRLYRLYYECLPKKICPQSSKQIMKNLLYYVSILIITIVI